MVSWILIGTIYDKAIHDPGDQERGTHGDKMKDIEFKDAWGHLSYFRDNKLLWRLKFKQELYLEIGISQAMGVSVEEEELRARPELWGEPSFMAQWCCIATREHEVNWSG